MVLDDTGEGGHILSWGWPIDHETECGLCAHSFPTILPNGLHYEDIYCPDGCQFQEEEVEEMDSNTSFITTAAREYIVEKGEEGCEKLADSDNNGCHFPEEKVEEMDNKTSFIMK